jgi:hypothetical protein
MELITHRVIATSPPLMTSEGRLLIARLKSIISQSHGLPFYCIYEIISSSLVQAGKGVFIYTWQRGGYDNRIIVEDTMNEGGYENGEQQENLDIH